MANAKQEKIHTLTTTGILVAMLPGLGFSSPAFAYLDPGTGSIILQGLIAGIMVVVAAWGMFWQRIKAFFLSIFSSSKSTGEGHGNDSDK